MSPVVDDEIILQGKVFQEWSCSKHEKGCGALLHYG